MHHTLPALPPTPPHPTPPHPHSLPGHGSLQVVHIDRPYGDAPPAIPTQNVNYHRSLVAGERPLREDIKPLDIVQPEGASWTVGGVRVVACTPN